MTVLGGLSLAVISFECTRALKVIKLWLQVSKSDTILSLQVSSGSIILVNIDERQKF
jgi:hypothetical protein